MTPADYVAIVAWPTIQEFMDDPTDQRRAYLACITAFHITDHIAAAEGHANGSPVCERLRAEAGGAKLKAINVVQGICNGSKHVATKPKSQQLEFRAGADLRVPAFAFDVPEAGFDQAVWGSPARVVIDQSGTVHAVHVCVGRFLAHVGAVYARHFPEIRMSQWDR